MTHYIITDIGDEGGTWGRTPDSEYATADEALAAAQAYVDAHVDEGDYGQTPVTGVSVTVYIEVCEVDDAGEELDDERHGYTTTAGGHIDVSDEARALYERVAADRYIYQVGTDDQAAADELVGAGVCRWASEYMSDSEPGLRPVRA